MRVDQIETPCLVVNLEQVEKNIASAVNSVRASGKTYRPHTKTHKSPVLARMQLEAGASGITVAKLGEAEVMADHGFEDILVANLIVGEEKLERLARLGQRCRIVSSVDNREGIRQMEAFAARRGARFAVMLEIDCGGNRCGVAPRDAVDLALAIDASPHLELAGLLSYEGHIYSGRDWEQRRRAAVDGARVAAATAEAVREKGVEVPVLSMGSTLSLPFLPEMHGVTEIRSGTCVFYDSTSFSLGACPLESCALSVHTRVVGVYLDHAILDAGSKTISPERTPEFGSIEALHGYIPENPEWKLWRMNEEHGHVKFADGSASPGWGERVRVIPAHVCTTVNLHDWMFVVKGDTVVDQWKVASRGRVV